MILKIIFTAVLTLPFMVSAANPSVESFVPSSTSLNSGQIVSFTWRMKDASGYSFLIPCLQGIKIKKTDGAAFACDTKISSVVAVVDGIDLLFYNISGATKNVTIHVIPKDTTDIDYDLGRQDLSVSLATAPEPITTFTGSTSTPSFMAYPITWTSNLLDGTNLSISCSSNIRASSTSYAQVYLPCNTPVFPTDLAGSGTLTLYFSNDSPTTETITLTILPAMSAGAYDGSHIKTLEVAVKSKILPGPSVTYFTTATTSIITADTPVIFTWATENAPSTNLQLSCNDTLTARTLINNATTTLKCGSLAFNTPLSANGAITVYFSNNSFVNQSMSISLLPELTTGGFDGTRAKTISLSVTPKGVSVSTTSPIATTIAQITSIPPEPAPIIEGCIGTTRYSPNNGQLCPIIEMASTTLTKSTGKKFLINLRRGTKHAEVRTLQEFLRTDRIIYPEGIVSGFYGLATERAIGRLQIKYNIARPGIPGYGAIGPKTRALLNSL
jgi:hypothetical protein